MKIIFFPLSGLVQAESDARPNFTPDSKSLLLGLSNCVSFVSEFVWEWGEKKQNAWPKT